MQRGKVLREASHQKELNDIAAVSKMMTVRGGSGDSPQIMSPATGRFTNNSLPSLQAELCL